MVAYILLVLVTGVLTQLKTRIGKLAQNNLPTSISSNLVLCRSEPIEYHGLPGGWNNCAFATNDSCLYSSIGKCNKFSFNANFQNFERLYLISVYLALGQTKLLLTILYLISPFLKSCLIKNVIKMLIDSWKFCSCHLCILFFWKIMISLFYAELIYKS